MSQQTFLKVPFVWEEPKLLLEVPPRLIFEPVKAKYGNQLVPVVARIMALSLDASDQRRASDNDPHTAVEMFLNSARDDFSYQEDWWQFGINERGCSCFIYLSIFFILDGKFSEIIGFIVLIVFLFDELTRFAAILSMAIQLVLGEMSSSNPSSMKVSK